MNVRSDRGVDWGSPMDQWAAGRADSPAQVIESASLFADRKEVQIRHAGELYRLRITRNGRLILNK